MIQKTDYPDDRRNNERRCYDCSGYQARLDDHEDKLAEHDNAIRSIWKALTKKLGNWWLVLILPFIMLWLGFQGSMYNGVKNIQRDVAVIQMTLKLRNNNGR